SEICSGAVIVCVWFNQCFAVFFLSDQVLSITPKTQEQVEVVRNVSTQYETVLWQPVSHQYITEETQVHLFVPANSVQSFHRFSCLSSDIFRVLLANPSELIEMQTKNYSTDPRSSSTFYERYHSLEDIYYWINRTTMDNTDKVKAILIGSSYEKRPLYVLKVQPNKKAAWIDCGIHAREWISPAFCLWFVQYKRMWRKNRSLSRSRWGSTCIGVDLNRNFDANWCTEGASPEPCSEIYCGAFPESEPESQAVANFLRTHKDSVQLYISIHSYSQMLLFPYSCTMDEAENHSDLVSAAQNIRRFYRTNYKYGAGAKTIYLAPGGSDDWAYKLGIKYSFTFELQDRGEYGFLLPPSKISKACNEALIAVKTIALKVIEKTKASADSSHTAKNVMPVL
uniref:Carboxypeptidase B2 (plasma) n=1 Tax=Echeneis naucrates TaxID=173247 RepID=A0A665TYJ6_ECHNA